jgi:apolipoprotein N-acyltransferase
MKKNLVLALLTGILFAFSLPPFKTGFLAYGALIPFFLLLENKRGFDLFRWSYVTGLFVFTCTLFWLWNVTIPGLLGTILVLPLYFSLYAAFHSFVLKKFPKCGLLLVPFAWTAIEYLQVFGETAFPWVYLGYTQSYYLPLIQYAEFTGVYGISFWVACLNVLLFYLWKNKENKQKIIPAIVIVALFFMLPFLYGFLRISQKPAGQPIKIALIQGNIDPFEKWDPDLVDVNFDSYIQMTKEAMNEKPELVIWPETATSLWLRYERNYRNRIHHIVDSTGIPLLTGAVDYRFNNKGDYNTYNSAFLFEPNSSRLQDYKKMKLVPFSERVPYSHFMPIGFFRNFLSDMALGVGDYSRGKDYKTLSFLSSDDYKVPSFEREDVTKTSLSVSICYESVFPDFVRTFVDSGADFLAVITNDAWFGKTPAPFQHTQMAAVRAIENRRSVARCANTGVSCFIDPFG